MGVFFRDNKRAMAFDVVRLDSLDGPNVEQVS